MKKEEIPQDNGALNKLTREVCYVVDEKGNYTTALSSGWEVKATALDATWKDIDQRIFAVKKEVLEGRSSPIRYFMELRLMDLEILSAYTGFWKWQIRRHLNPGNFGKLSKRSFEKYAKAFNVTVEQLKKMEANED
jgi:hypothetical protein